MNIETQRIIEEVSRLSPIERAEIIEYIIESFDSEPDEEIKNVWIAEAQRRLAMHKNGDTNTLSEDEVFNCHKAY